MCRSYIRDQKRAPLSYEDVMGGTRHEGSAILDMEPTPQESSHGNCIRSCSMALREGQSNDPASDQLSVREVANTLECRSAVKNRLHSARARLREVLLPLSIGQTGLEPEG